MNAATLALLALVSLNRPIANQENGEPDGNKLVAIELVADRNPIQPGSTFTLALRCKIERRWHVYWGENSGTSGLPFKALITGPAGYEIGKVRFPWPKRHEAPGDIVEFIHEGEMVCLVDVKVPPTAKAGESAQFDVAAKWLVCTTVCVAGSGATALTLPVAEASVVANEALFTAARAKEPRPWSDLGRAGATWSGTEETPKLTLVVPGITAAEFFPYRSSTTNLVRRKVDIGKQGGTLALEFEFEKKEDGDKPDARGVLWVKTDKGETSYLFDKPYQK